MSATPGLISIDGPLAGGKTPFAQRLTKALAADQGATVLTTALSATQLGEFVRGAQFYLRGLPLAYAAAADRQLQLDSTVAPALEAGKFVVVDRYVPTALALDGFGAGCALEHIMRLYEHMPIPQQSYLVLAPLEYRVERLRAKDLIDDYSDWFMELENEEACYQKAADYLTDRGWNVEFVRQPMEHLTDDDIASWANIIAMSCLRLRRC